MSNIQNSQGGIPLSDEALLDAVALDDGIQSPMQLPVLTLNTARG